ncbi:hypothetical protein BZL29_4352 [Mycobacterium kansasii]|uniref:Uncharacterized protein n=1 Tax=Mycobacterium kansasii TaxID=1768 RepID=A0A1V3X7C9_MYCKA|nr:hypothetical protein BZL29_4352 [Mycobacterium kansasii]
MVGQPEFDGSLSGNSGAGQRVFLGQHQADVQRPGQRTTICGHQSHLHMRVGKVGVFGDVDDVTQGDQAAAQPDGRAVDRCHHRHSAACHTQHDVAPVRNGLGAQIGVVGQLGQIREIAACRERPAGAGEHRSAGSAIVAQSRPQLRQPDMQIVVDGVEGIGAVQGDDAQRPVGTNVDFCWHVVHFKPLIPGFAKR